MGAGKTTVGRALGLRLNWLFEDLDERIERRERRTVAEIFRDSGESAFRRAEHEALRELIEELRGGSARIIALGGGAFVQEDNASLLRSSPVTAVFLDAPADELWARCQTQAHAGNNNAVKNNAVKNNKDQITNCIKLGANITPRRLSRFKPAAEMSNPSRPRLKNGLA
jgi:shikimate kinase